MALSPPNVKAQSPESAAGHWEGSITLPGTELGIRVDLVLENDTWVGTIDIPVQGLRGFALSKIAIKDNNASFKIPIIPGSPVFNAKIESEKNKISGTFTQALKHSHSNLFERQQPLRKEPHRQRAPQEKASPEYGRVLSNRISSNSESSSNSTKPTRD